ncbi:SCO-spondin [Nymphon striatum]|nr:SCO-spondin [Nymphon striatum]
MSPSFSITSPLSINVIQRISHPVGCYIRNLHKKFLNGKRTWWLWLWPCCECEITCDCELFQCFSSSSRVEGLGEEKDLQGTLIPHCSVRNRIHLPQLEVLTEKHCFSKKLTGPQQCTCHCFILMNNFHGKKCIFACGFISRPKYFILTGGAIGGHLQVCTTWGASSYRTFDNYFLRYPLLYKRDLLTFNRLNILQYSPFNIRSLGSKVAFCILIENAFYHIVFSRVTHWLVVTSTQGYILKWDGSQTVTIHIDSKWKNGVRGLCGTFDDDPTNDLTSPDGSSYTHEDVEQFASSWENPNLITAGQTCLNTAKATNFSETSTDAQRENAYVACEQILGDDCRPHVPQYLWYFSRCMNEYLGCEDGKTCNCDTLAEYHRQCFRNGRAPFDWGGPQSCSTRTQCTEDKSYNECGSLCLKTCSNRDQTTCPGDHCVEGCLCPPDNVLNSHGVCIPVESCPCEFQGLEYEDGETVKMGCESCSCVKGYWKCNRNKCGARCSQITDVHYETFDGKAYDFTGECYYIMVQNNDVVIAMEKSGCSSMFSHRLCGTYTNNQDDDFETPTGDLEVDAYNFANKWKLPPANGQCGVVQKIDAHPCTINTEMRMEDAEKICNKLIDMDVFKVCHSAVNPEPFFKDCLYDVCSCKTKGSECICSIFSAYVTACNRENVLIEWRNEINECGINCAGDQTWTTCANPCIDSCMTIAEYTECEDRCFEGCSCPEGETLDVNGRCVPIDQCPCIHENKEYESGYRQLRGMDICECKSAAWDCHISSNAELIDMAENELCPAADNKEDTDCRAKCPDTCKTGYIFDESTNRCIFAFECPCFHGGHRYNPGDEIQQDCKKCVCNAGNWQCDEKECPAECSAWGLEHYSTFDGKKFDFIGDCAYTLAKGNIDDYLKFEVTIQNYPCSTTGMTCTKYISIKTGLDIGLYVYIKTDVGLSALWDKGSRIYLRLMPSWKNKTVQGLCGNYDGDQSNDFMGPMGGFALPLASTFADEWKSFPYCPNAKEYVEWALKACGVLYTDTFASCHGEVDPDPFHSRCVSDSCACDTGGDCGCLCSALAAYAQVCNKMGVPLKWRSQALCPIQCQTCDEYSPCKSVNPPLTCQTKEAYPELVWKCPEGQVYLDESSRECIPEEVCPVVNCTMWKGEVIVEGEPVTGYKSECEQCFCSKGNITCVGQPCTTTTLPPTSSVPVTTPRCPNGETFDPCAFQCNKTCESLLQELINADRCQHKDDCIPGCETKNCEDPKVWLDIETCVDLNECPCRMENGSYVAIDFMEPRNMSGLLLQGFNGSYPKSIQIEIGDTLSKNNPSNSSEVKEHIFDEITEGRYIKITILTYHNAPAMRLEPLGCYHPYPTTPPPPAPPCPELTAIMLNNCTFPCNVNQSCDGTQCVATKDCPCVKENQKYAVGTLLELTNCDKCICQAGGISDCSPLSCDDCPLGKERNETNSCSCDCKCKDNHRLCPTDDICIPDPEWCDGIQTCTDDETGCPEPDTCEYIGDNIETFDGVDYDYQICNNVLMHDKINDSFSVDIHRECNTTETNACTKYLIIRHGDHILKLSDNLTVEYRGSLYSRFELIVRISVEIEFKSTNLNMSNFNVIWTKQKNVKIEIKADMYQKVDGLCGHYDGNQTDDLMLPDGSTTTNSTALGDNWERNETGVLETCVLHACDRDVQVRATELCTSIIVEPLHVCTELVNVKDKYKACISTLCDCSTSSNRTLEECLCDILEPFATDCQAARSGEPIQGWREKYSCIPECDNTDMTWQECGPLCETTCENYEGTPECETDCIPGCYCPAGLVLNAAGEKCVEPKECMNCLCSGYGDPHYTSFDGLKYTAVMDCDVFLARHSASEFDIRGYHGPCEKETSMTCLNKIKIEIDEIAYSIIISPTTVRLKKVHFKKYRNYVHPYLLCPSILLKELEITYFAANHGFRVAFPSKLYYNEVAGTCGECLYQYYVCDQFYSAAFSKCNPVVDPQSYVDACKRDYALATMKKTAVCKNLMAYARECCLESIVLDDWMDAVECPQECPEGMEFMVCQKPCLKTCENFKTFNMQTCPMMPVDGCFCPEQMALVDGKCQNPEVGDVWDKGPCTTCSCNCSDFVQCVTTECPPEIACSQDENKVEIPMMPTDCCQQHRCVPKCADANIPTCGVGERMITNVDSKNCSYYQCVPPPATCEYTDLNGETVDYQFGDIWTDGPCKNCSCKNETYNYITDCVEEQCQDLSGLPDAAEGTSFNNTGDPCVTYSCAKDFEGQLTKKTLVTECSVRCLPFESYVEPDLHVCCGGCKPDKCIHEGTNRMINETWTDEADVCKNATCIMNEYMTEVIIKSKYECPQVDSNCPEKFLVPDDDYEGCCNKCTVEPECVMFDVPQNETVGLLSTSDNGVNCTNEEEIPKLTYCKGTCGNHCISSTGDFTASCDCCEVEEYEEMEIDLKCTDATTSTAKIRRATSFENFEKPEKSFFHNFQPSLVRLGSMLYEFSVKLWNQMKVLIMKGQLLCLAEMTIGVNVYGVKFQIMKSIFYDSNFKVTRPLFQEHAQLVSNYIIMLKEEPSLPGSRSL